MSIAQGDSGYTCRDEGCREPAFPTRDRKESHEDLFHPPARRRYGCRLCEAGDKGAAAASKSGFFSPKHLEYHRRFKHPESDDCLIDRQPPAAVGGDGGVTEAAAASPAAVTVPPYTAALAATADNRQDYIKGLQALFEDHQALAEASERQAATIAGLRSEISELNAEKQRANWAAQTLDDAAKMATFAAQVARGLVAIPAEPAGT